MLHKYRSFRVLFTHYKPYKGSMRYFASNSGQKEENETAQNVNLVERMKQLRIESEDKRYSLEEFSRPESVNFAAQLSNKRWNDPNVQIALEKEDILNIFRDAKDKSVDEIASKFPSLEHNDLEKLLKHYALPVIVED